MNKEIKEKWVAALKSGEYKQTAHCLKDHEGFCCLGVLTDLYLKEQNLEWIELHEDYVAPDPEPGHEERIADQVLPETVVKWADLPSNCPYPSGYTSNLAELNDTEGYDFEDIADVIQDCF